MIYKVRPTAKSIKKFSKDFAKHNFYDNSNYIASINLTKAFYSNNSYQNIYIKVNYINGAFKTAIGDTSGVARSIYEKISSVDKRLKKGDISLINEISYYKSSKSKKIRNNFSFATKYCHCHQPKLFPINDRYVRNSLYKFNSYHSFSIFTKKDLLNYQIFLKVLTDFRDFAEGSNLDFATIDRFLWALGREDVRKKERNNGR